MSFQNPDGIVDKGSNPEKTALTELCEETGYKCIGKPKKILSTSCLPDEENIVSAGLDNNIYITSIEGPDIHGVKPDIKSLKRKMDKIKEYEITPGDMQILGHVNKKVKENKYKVVFIPNITCRKDTDGNIPK